MAKAKVTDVFESLVKRKHGRSIMQDMTESQRKMFREFLELYRNTPRQLQPAHVDLATAMSEHIGVTISKHTLTRYLRDAEFGKTKV